MAGISSRLSHTSANDDREVCLDILEKVFLLSSRLLGGNNLWNNSQGYHVYTALR